MSSSTLVPVYQYILRLYASISSINHALYSLYCITFDQCFYKCDVVAETSLCITFLIHE